MLSFNKGVVNDKNITIGAGKEGNYGFSYDMLIKEDLNDAKTGWMKVIELKNFEKDGYAGVCYRRPIFPGSDINLVRMDLKFKGI